MGGFLFESAILGVGLAMDAFSASLANALKEPDMGPARGCAIAGTFAAFQIAMPLLGWLAVHTLASRVEAFLRLTPWIALLLLLWIGGKMLWEGVRYGSAEQPAVGTLALLGQGIDPRQAVPAAVWLHGRAGDLAAEELGEYGMTPEDLLDRIPAAILDAMA